jgi:hypothetical protein
LRSRDSHEIAAGARSLIAFAFAGRLRGLVSALVDVHFAAAPPARRRYRLRL